MEKLYYNEVKKYPLLSAEEEHELVLEKCKGNELATEKLINCNLRLVIKIAHSYKTNVPLFDLIQEGNIGLMKAIQNFDPSYGCRLTTYASYWIRQAIERFILGRGRERKIPMHKHQIYKKIEPLIDTIPISEIADMFGIGVSLVQSLIKNHLETWTIDKIESSEKLEDIHSINPEKEYFEQELRQELNNAVNSLFDNEKKVIESHYGLNREQKVLRAIGKDIDTSLETVRQIELGALNKLKNQYPHLQVYM